LSRSTGKAAAAATTPTRLLDSVPYAGGDRITSLQTISGKQYAVQCTVSVEVLPSSGGDATLSAGHCGPTGTLWYQGYYANNTVYNTGIMGTTATTQWGNGRIDGELIEGSQYGYYPAIYTTSTELESVNGIAVTGTGSELHSLSVELAVQHRDLMEQSEDLRVFVAVGARQQPQ
jgi:hypothetical protein